MEAVGWEARAKGGKEGGKEGGNEGRGFKEQGARAGREKGAKGSCVGGGGQARQVGGKKRGEGSGIH